MSNSNSSDRENYEVEKKFQKKRKSKNSNKNKDYKKKLSSINKEEISEISDLIENFNLLFLEEKAKPSERKLIEFTKKYFIDYSEENDDNSLNYKLFIVFIIKLCGLEIEIEDKNEISKFLKIKNSNFTEEEFLNDLIENCKLRTAKIKIHLISSSLNSITQVIYNSFEIIKENEFEKFKNFIISIIKLSNNKYRQLRYLSCIILSKIFELLFNEISKTKKIVKEKNKLIENSEKPISKGTLTLLKNKIEILNELIILFKENFIIKKIYDISKEIRSMIAETLYKISKKNFNLLFFDNKLVQLFPYVLNDPHSSIKIKYLTLLYDKLSELNNEDNEEEEENEENKNNEITSKKINNNMEVLEEEKEESLKLIMKIFSLTKDIILSISIDEDKNLSKMGIRIIELLSNQNILESKTINQLLPHLLNPELGIRILISKIIISYILNFEKKNENKKYIHSINDVHTLVEFTHKLTDNNNKLVSIIVDNFYNYLEIFKNFKIFFDFIDEQLNNSNCELYLIHCALLIIKYSISKIQNIIENEDKSNLIPINDDFINLIIKKIILYLKKFKVPLFENIIQNSQIKILNISLDLFNNLKIYGKNSLNFPFDSIKDIINEIIMIFFSNTSAFGENEMKNNEDDKESFEINFNNENTLFEKLCNNLLNGILCIINNKELYEFFQYNQTKLIEDFIYGNLKDKNSLKIKFISIFKNEILDNNTYSKFINTDMKNISECIGLLNDNLFIKLYNIFTQMNYILIYFPKIFNEDNINFSQFISFLLKILSLNLSSIPSNEKLLFNFKFNKMILTLIETLNIFLFTKLESKNKLIQINEYCNLRNDIYNLFFSIINMNYNESNFTYNNHILIIKTKVIGIFLDSLVFVSNDNIKNQDLKFIITTQIENLLIQFMRDNFIKFFIDYNKYLKNNNEIENDSNKKKERKSMSYIKHSIFKDEYSLKTLCLKIIVNKFSRLLLLNFSMFKYIEFCCIYFETFYLIQYINSIEKVSNYTLEALMDREIQHFIELKKNEPENKNYLTIIIFYLTKISMKIFNEKSLLFPNEGINLLYEDKVEMIGRFINNYSRILKKLKNKYKDENIFEKDKIFFENFILNGINFSLENKIPNKNDSKIIDIENVYFLEIIKIFLKTNLFFNESDIKNFIVAYLNMSKNIELEDGININHIKFMEKFKNYLLNKGNVVLGHNNEERENDNNNNENDKNNDSINKTKKKKSEENLEKEDNNKENEDDIKIDEQEIIKKKKSKKEEKKEKNKIKTKINIKRKYNEIIKEEEDDNNNDKQINSKKIKKE